MANPICLSPLKFYEKLDRQERFKSYSYGNISPAIMKYGELSPFQFVLSNNDSEVKEVYLCSPSTDKPVTSDIYTLLFELGLRIKKIGNYKVLLYQGLSFYRLGKPEEAYYLRIVTDKSEYISEVFCFTENIEEYIEIEYWNPESDFNMSNGVVTFFNDFRFKLLVCSEIGKPEYSFEEQATSRFGYTFVENQVSKKVYKFNTILPEYICDAMRIIRLCSNKRIKCKGEVYDALSFNMDVEWQTQGDLAAVSCEFEVDNIIVNFGGYNKDRNGGDYNNDFNNDFKIN